MMQTVLSDTPAHLVLVGAIGVGKSTVARSLAALLHELAIPHGSIEFDQMGQCFLPDAGPDCIFELRLRNLRHVDAELRAAGASRILVNAAPRDADRLQRMLDALRARSMFVVRLRAAGDEVERRIRERNIESTMAVDEEIAASHRQQHMPLPSVDLDLDATTRHPDDIAARIVEAWDAAPGA